MITNKHGLPEEVYNALCKNRYAGDATQSSGYSATALIAPIQQTILKKRYPGCGSEDAIDRVWSLFGHIAHSLLEEHGSDDALTEKRFFADIYGTKISGQVDHYKDGIITDYKTTSAYKICKKSYDDWEKQLNVYAYLARANGLEVRNLRIIAIIRDWSEADAYKPDYPKTPIVEIPLTLWDYTTQDQWVRSRVSQIEFNETKGDDALMPCSREERWQAESKWAVLKDSSAKRASRVFDSEQEAWSYLGSLTLANRTGDEIVVERQGEPRRCLKYCSVSSVCVQHQDYLKQKGDQNGTQIDPT